MSDNKIESFQILKSPAKSDVKVLEEFGIGHFICGVNTMHIIGCRDKRAHLLEVWGKFQMGFCFDDSYVRN